MGRSAAEAVVRKPRTKAGKRFLEGRAPKAVENAKTALLCRGGKTSELVSACLKDWAALKKPLGHLLSRHHPIHPFDDDTGLEKLCKKFDASLFLFGLHSKKRPHNLVLGRMFDHHVLDMVELGLEGFQAMEALKAVRPMAGVKPAIVFAGEEWESGQLFPRLQNLLLDFFQGERAEKLRLEGLELLISFTLSEGLVRMRVYRVLLKASGTRLPRAELEEVGPRCDLRPRRSRLAEDALWRLARKQPKTLKPKARKNLSKDVFGSKLARVHVGKQDTRRIQTRKLKGLKGQAAKAPKEPREA